MNDMTETPTNKPARRISRTFLIWLASFLLIALATAVLLLRTDRAPNKYPDIVWSLIFGVVGASLLVCLLAFICWLRCWRNLRRTLIGLAILATLIAIFYTEEYWRGKHAWEVCKRQFEARGLVLDWDKFIPPPIPDDQNFYTASTNILLRFKRLSENDTNEIEAARQSKWLNLTPAFSIYNNSTNGPIVVAKIVILQGNENALPAGTNNFTVTLNDTGASNQIRDRIRDILRSGIGQFIHGAEGFDFSEFQLTNLPLVQIFVKTPAPPPIETLNTFCPSDAVAGFAKLKVIATSDPGTFDILLTDMRITSAADYLKWSDQFVPAFDEIREALKRPYAIIPGDYSVPYSMPIPNFVTLRALAQTLAQRAQCYFLLNEPDKALHELTLIHDVCRILEKPPTGKPETLVEAMINVAIHGLYVTVIAEGMQRHVWQEPQLATLQNQLEQINLPPFVAQAFQTEPAATARTLETISKPKLQLWFSISPNLRSAFWPTLKWELLPRGWIYQNMVTSARMTYSQTEGFDSANNLFEPKKFGNVADELKKVARPYSFIAAEAIPNFTKAWQTSAYNQTQVNEAQIACALERYHLAYGQYPDTLDALVPQFMQTIPHDIIGGQPLHYHRTDDGKFLLYSVGWNETDDGGKPSPHTSNNINDYSKGDWAWPTTAK